MSLRPRFIAPILAVLASCHAGDVPGTASPLDGGTRDAGVQDAALDGGTTTRLCPRTQGVPCDGRVHCIADPATDRPLAGRLARREDLEATLRTADAAPYTGDKHDYTAALLVDTDADGRTDLLYSRALGSHTWRISQPSAGVFRNEGMLPAPLDTCQTAADLDGDGARDVLCGAFVAWGGPRGVAWEAATILGQGANGRQMTTTLADFDEDGLLDVLLGFFGSPKAVYRNRGDRTFEEMGARWGLAMSGLTWCVGTMDFDGDGRADVFMMHDGSNKPNAAFRALGPGPDGEPRYERFYPVPQECDPQGFFRDGNLTPMGAATGDVDLDGVPDLFLASITPGALLVRQDDGRWLDAIGEFRLATPLTDTSQRAIPWSPALWDVDHDGYLDLLLAGGDDEGHGMMPGRGNSHAMLYHGRSGNRFDEVHADLGLTAQGNFQSIALGDLDGDLDLDLVFGGFGQVPVVYENQLTPTGEHLLLELRGRFSNPGGFGARVEVDAGTLHRTYWVGTRFSPQVADSGLLDVALGAAHAADTIRVTWPSGYVQEVHGLAAGQRRVVEEPALVTLDPPSRHVRAGAPDGVRITVRAVDPAGSPRSGAGISVRALDPALAWEGPASVQPDGSVVRVLRAPAHAGSTAIEVSVDGVPYRVRPRVWFD